MEEEVRVVETEREGGRRGGKGRRERVTGG